MRSFNKIIRNHVRVALVTSAFIVALGSSTQIAFAGPVAPPPGKMAAKTCVKNGKVGIKTAKGCIVKQGPVAPPPGM